MTSLDWFGDIFTSQWHTIDFFWPNRTGIEDALNEIRYETAVTRPPRNSVRRPNITRPRPVSRNLRTIRHRPKISKALLKSKINWLISGSKCLTFGRNVSVNFNVERGRSSSASHPCCGLTSSPSRLEDELGRELSQDDSSRPTDPWLWLYLPWSNR